MSDEKKIYQWICFDCGMKYGRMHQDHLCTVHNDVCDWCGEIKPVTQPRDFGYPVEPS